MKSPNSISINAKMHIKTKSMKGLPTVFKNPALCVPILANAHPKLSEAVIQSIKRRERSQPYGRPFCLDLRSGTQSAAYTTSD